MRSRRERCRAWSRRSAASGLATAASADVERVLVPKDADVVENVSVAFQVKRLRLRSGEHLLVGAVEVVLECEVERVEVAAEHVNGRIARLGAPRSLAGVVDQDGRRRVCSRSAQRHVGLVDDYLLAIDAGCNENCPACSRNGVDRCLDCLVLRRAIGGNMKNGCYRCLSLAVRRDCEE